MKPLSEIINTDNEPNLIDKIMSKEKPEQIEVDEWIYKGCFIQMSEHPQLKGKYEVFKNNKEHSHIDRCYTFTEAKKICELNECNDNSQKRN